MLRYIVPCVVALFISCALAKKSGNEDCFSKVENQVKNKWEYNKQENYYMEKSVLLSLTSPEYYDCVKTLNRKQVIKLFGKPSEIDKENKKLIYYQMPACNENSTYCAILYFKFQGDRVYKFHFRAAISKSH